jgi:hypothetical protein
LTSPRGASRRRSRTRCWRAGRIAGQCATRRKQRATSRRAATIDLQALTMIVPSASSPRTSSDLSTPANPKSGRSSRRCGVLENIDTTSRQLQDALQDKKTIIVTTLQKFPVIAGKISELSGQRFAVIIDEAHSSQSGESAKSLKAVLSIGAPAKDEQDEDEEAAEDSEQKITAEIKRRGRLPNVSYFAFTATPRSQTVAIPALLILHPPSSARRSRASAAILPYCCLVRSCARSSCARRPDCPKRYAARSGGAGSGSRS